MLRKLPEEYLRDPYATTPEIIYPNTSQLAEEENLNSEVKTYFLPEAFTWIGKKQSKCQVGMKKYKFFICSSAAQKAGLKVGDRISFGVNKKYMLIKKDEESEIQCLEGDKRKRKRREYETLRITTIFALKKVLKENGWPESFIVDVKLQDNMLVGEKPVLSGDEIIETGQEQAIHPWRS